MRTPVNIERAYALLPATAPPEQELDWCSSHELFFRDPNPSGEPHHIGIPEIWHPENGKCPSRRAANMLKHWTRSPKRTEEFQKLVIGQHKLKLNNAAPESDTEDALPEDLASIKSMLAAAGN